MRTSPSARSGMELLKFWMFELGSGAKLSPRGSVRISRAASQFKCLDGDWLGDIMMLAYCV